MSKEKGNKNRGDVLEFPLLPPQARELVSHLMGNQRPEQTLTDRPHEELGEIPDTSGAMPQMTEETVRESHTLNLPLPQTQSSSWRWWKALQNLGRVLYSQRTGEQDSGTAPPFNGLPAGAVFLGTSPVFPEGIGKMRNGGAGILGEQQVARSH